MKIRNIAVFAFVRASIRCALIFLADFKIFMSDSTKFIVVRNGLKANSKLFI